MTMVSNYFKIAYRILLKQKTYAIANIIGLGIGLAATILILSYIEFESSYDDFQQNTGNLYRISIRSVKEGKMESDSPEFTPPIGPAMVKEFPEVENYVRLSVPHVEYFSSNERTFRINGIIYADSTFFNLFSFQLIQGNPIRALAEPYSIVLNEETSKNLFGNENPMGKIITINGHDSYHVTGIVKSPPSNSHIQFKALKSFSTLYHDPNLFMDWDGGYQYITYVRLRADAHPQDIQPKLPGFMWGYINQKLAPVSVRLEPYLQPFSDIHLLYSPESESTRSNIYVFTVVAFFILFIACVNFINLAIARATKRMREVGVRKVLGANRSMLVRQFLSESSLTTLLASVVALLLVEMVFPLYKNVLAENVNEWSIAHVKPMLELFAIVVTVAFAAGSYPAFYLSSLQIVKTLKDTSTAAGSKGKLRNLLIMLQFGISIALIASTVLVGMQLAHLKDMELGFSKDNIVVLPLIGEDAKLNGDLLKKEIMRLPGVIHASASSDIPLNDFTSNGYFPEGQKTPMMIHVVDVDDDYLTTFGITLVQGRSFSPEFPSDKTAYLINQSLARSLAWDNPVGKTISRDMSHTVIGVVKDFNFATLHSNIQPLIITHHPWRDRYDDLSVKINGTNISGTMNAIQDIWKKLVPSAPLHYYFLDESFNHLYDSEERFEKIFFCFSALAIWIALMGMLSLASYATEQRTKEIAIRKILGASSWGITTLFSKEFLQWVLLANIVAWPTAYFFITRWLENFAYRIDVGWAPFILAGVITLLLGWATVSIQTAKAVRANPVEGLRYE